MIGSHYQTVANSLPTQSATRTVSCVLITRSWVKLQHRLVNSNQRYDPLCTEIIKKQKCLENTHNKFGSMILMK